jgi:phage replication-related protein YjqB (UPF0714/DUF867 family)
VRSFIIFTLHNIIRVSTHGRDDINEHKILVGKPEKERLSRKREDNMKQHLKKIGCDDVDWINLAQD